MSDDVLMAVAEKAADESVRAIADQQESLKRFRTAGFQLVTLAAAVAGILGFKLGEVSTVARAELVYGTMAVFVAIVVVGALVNAPQVWRWGLSARVMADEEWLGPLRDEADVVMSYARWLEEQVDLNYAQLRRLARWYQAGLLLLALEVVLMLATMLSRSSPT